MKTILHTLAKKMSFLSQSYLHFFVKKGVVQKKNAFTLVEILVAITIFLIIMVSVFMIYASATQTAINTNINREMQQNIKSIVETIAEDVRKNGIEGVKASPTGIYEKEGIHFFTKKNGYKLFGYDTTFKKMEYASIQTLSKCKELKYICFIQKIGSSGTLGPLSNSRVSIIGLSYRVDDEVINRIKKVVISLTLRASIKNGIRSGLVEKSTINFQTTISERYLPTK